MPSSVPAATERNATASPRTPLPRPLATAQNKREDAVLRARNDVAAGMSVRNAAKRHGVAASTVWDRSKGKQPRNLSHAANQLLTEVQVSENLAVVRIE